MKKAGRVLAVSVFVIVLLAAAFLPGEAVWAYIRAMLCSASGVVTLLTYRFSGHADINDYKNYVPLNIYDPGFDGANAQIALQAEMTGEKLPQLGKYFEGQTEYAARLKALSWSGLWVWVLFIVAVIAVVKLVKKREQQGLRAVVPVCWMLSCIVAAPTVCAAMLHFTNRINASATFIVMEIAALAVFLGAFWKEEPRNEAVEEAKTETVNAVVQQKETAHPGRQQSKPEQITVTVDRSEETLTCPNCNRTQRSDRRICYNCGAIFEDQ